MMPRSALQIVDEQFARWQLEVHERSRRPLLPSQVHDVVAISSAYGSRGLAIAEAVADSLSLPIFNHEFVTSIAEKAHVRVATVEALDETAEGAVDDWLDTLTREKSFSQSDYFRALSHVVGALWKRGPCILVGHGANCLVPADHRLAVRVTAPVEVRCETIVKAEGLDQHAARRKLKHEDVRQEDFMRRLFHVHVESPIAYDLVLNTHHMSVAEAAAAIVTAFHQKFSVGNKARPAWA
jgi:cytidylate kinase